MIQMIRMMQMIQMIQQRISEDAPVEGGTLILKDYEVFEIFDFSWPRSFM